MKEASPYVLNARSFVKKKRAIDPQEAELVKEIFRLFQRDSGKSGPMGVRHIFSDLNSSGVTYRRGTKFASGLIHAMLTSTTYRGGALLQPAIKKERPS